MPAPSNPIASSILVIAFLSLLPGIHGDAQTRQDHERLRRADANWSYMDRDFSAEYRIVQESPGEGRSETVAAVFRRDRNDIYSIIVLEPNSERGQGYLKQEDTLWIYDPVSRRFNTTSSRARFQNTNARNSDFTQSTLSVDYDILSVQPTTLGRFDAYLYELESSEQGVTYPYMRVWITDDGLILKTEDFSLSRQLLRTTAIPSYQRVGNRRVPQQIYIIDMLEGASINGDFVNERTVITVSRASFEDLPDTVFSKAFLERVRR